MSVIPCDRNDDLRRLILEYSEVLKTEAHKLGTHGLGEKEFYNSGLFRGAVERIRGQFSASMSEKREFVRAVLNFMEDQGFIDGWKSAGEANRHDYSVTLPDGRTAVIELKGCMDGNNTIIFERPPHAQEFIIWSVCTNPGADPRHNAWSGIHTRLSADIIEREQQVNGVIIWDMVCGTAGRPCPKIQADPDRITPVAQYELPPPYIYVRHLRHAGHNCESSKQPKTARSTSRTRASFEGVSRLLRRASRGNKLRGLRSRIPGNGHGASHQNPPGRVYSAGIRSHRHPTGLVQRGRAGEPSPPLQTHHEQIERSAGEKQYAGYECASQG